jgi:hypothetical protein
VEKQFFETIRPTSLLKRFESTEEVCGGVCRQHARCGDKRGCGARGRRRHSQHFLASTTATMTGSRGSWVLRFLGNITFHPTASSGRQLDQYHIALALPFDAAARLDTIEDLHQGRWMAGRPPGRVRLYTRPQARMGVTRPSGLIECSVHRACKFRRSALHPWTKPLARR